MKEDYNSNILKLFSTKLNSEEFVKPLSLVNYINTFAENACGEESNSSFDLQLYLETLQLIPKPQIHLSQIECLTYVAGYAVFSYLKKSNACADCHNFLTTEKQIEVVNDMGSQFILNELLDRGSLKYPSIAVSECAKIV